jgi:two-component system phosphate regulon sensor histidine kinase PhoR
MRTNNSTIWLRKIRQLNATPLLLWFSSVRNRILVCMLLLGIITNSTFEQSLFPPGVGLILYGLGTFAVLDLFLARRFEKLMQLVRTGIIDQSRFEPRAFGGNDEMSRLGRAILEMAKDLRTTTLQANDRTRQLDELFSAIGEGVAVVELSGRIVRLNNTLKRWSGWYGESDGRQIFEVIKSLDLARAVGELESRLKATGSRTSSIRGDYGSAHHSSLAQELLRDFEPIVIDSMHLEGPEARRVKVKIVPVRDTQRQSIILFIYFLDITDIHKSEQLRREFFANVSHELKTPIAAIRGYAEVLRDMRSNIDEEKLQSFLTVIERNALSLSSLIDEMVTISKLESGILLLDIKQYNLRDALQRVFETCLPKAQIAKVDLSMDIPDDASIIPVDPHRFDSVLLNLVDNAIKYNRTGGYVKVSSRAAGNEFRIYVEDTGTGIPNEAAGRIFERFFRVDKSHARLGGGTGLGLAIAKHVVRAHGGTISVKSEIESGTVFKITVPVQPTVRQIEVVTPL